MLYFRNEGDKLLHVLNARCSQRSGEELLVLQTTHHSLQYLILFSRFSRLLIIVLTVLWSNWMCKYYASTVAVCVNLVVCKTILSLLLYFSSDAILSCVEFVLQAANDDAMCAVPSWLWYRFVWWWRSTGCFAYQSCFTNTTLVMSVIFLWFVTLLAHCYWMLCLLCIIYQMSCKHRLWNVTLSCRQLLGESKTDVYQ